MEWKESIFDAGGELYLVGGVPRDRIMMLIDSKDYDYIVRRIDPEDLVDILSKHGKTFMCGQSFGVIKFQDPKTHEIVDIALPRTETSFGEGHKDFDVIYDKDLPVEEDLGRRDFTMNAIAFNMQTGMTIDPFHGIADIQNRRIRAISDTAFYEDPLRILRGAQFAARFDMLVEDETYFLMRESAELVETIAGERVREELNKLMLKADDPEAGWNILRRTGALKHIFPELENCFGCEQNKFHEYDVWKHLMEAVKASPKQIPRVRWAALMHDVGKPPTRVIREKGGENRATFYRHEEHSSRIARSFFQRHKFPNRFTDEVCHLIEQHMFDYQLDWSDSAVRRFIKRVGKEWIDEVFELRKADAAGAGKPKTEKSVKAKDLKRRIQKEIENESATTIKELAVNGNDLKDAGIEPGPEMGKLLKKMLNVVLDDPGMNTREKLLAMVM
jgi:poly(A) polymerase/tRNA nucleotidyltransferase (CCA-adding enzyme)